MRNRLFTIFFIVFVLSGCTLKPTAPFIRQFTNSSLHYSFNYPNTLGLVAPQYSFEIEVPESGFGDGRDNYIVIYDVQNKNKVLMSIMQENSPQLIDFASTQAAVQNYIDYWTSSTSQYIYPEGNKISKPIQSEVTSNSGSKKDKFEYTITFIEDAKDVTPQTEKYDIYVISNGGKSAGSETIMPYSFLVIKYLQEDLSIVQPILDSFKFID